jgi:PadR family transcriptional regulator PadR
MIAGGPAPSAEGDRQTQLLRGALDMCLLAMLAKEATHGYDLVRRLDAIGFEGVGYGTIYPLLTRMRRLGLVADELHASPAGPPRKVYALTETGRARLQTWRQQWTRFVDTVDAALADTAHDSRRS